MAGDQIRHLADVGADQLNQAANNPGVQIADIADTGHVITTTLRRTAAALPGMTATTPAAVVAPVLRTVGVRR